MIRWKFVSCWLESNWLVYSIKQNLSPYWFWAIQGTVTVADFLPIVPLQCAQVFLKLLMVWKFKRNLINLAFAFRPKIVLTHYTLLCICPFYAKKRLIWTPQNNRTMFDSTTKFCKDNFAFDIKFESEKHFG